MPRQLVSIYAAADHLDVSAMTIRRYIAQGLLTGHRVGRRLIRVDLAEVEALLKPIPTVRVG